MRCVYPVLILFLSALLNTCPSAAILEQTSDRTWVVTQNGNVLQIAYGSGTNFPQYGALHLGSSYFRLNYGPNSGWGTSIILLPAFWSNGIYYQGAPITAAWEIVNLDLQLSITGTIAGLTVSTQVTLSPPTDGSITARVTSVATGSVSLDARPGEAFKPVMLSSMNISPSQWDARAAFANCQSFSIPESGWIIQAQPPVTAHNFGLLGGTSDWKTNAPTTWITFEQPMQVAGWATASDNPNDDNVGLWAASNEVLPSWDYTVSVTSATDLHCLFLPAVLKSTGT